MKKAAKKASPKRKAKREPEPDVNQLAQHLVRMSTEAKGPVAVEAPSQSEISRVMAALGKRGGKIGGKRRAERMTEGERSAAAARAATARWAKRK
jgi:hypothetical protein